MYSIVRTAAICGLQCRFISVEADVSNGMPVFEMVGYLASEVKEARERVRTAMRNSGYLLPAKRITVNLFPANVRKQGSLFDLAVAAAIMLSLGLIENRHLDEMVLVGEVGLDGNLHKAEGILPIAAAAKEQGIKICVVPVQNQKEAMLVEGLTIVGVRSLKDMAAYLNFGKLPETNSIYNIEKTQNDAKKATFDFSQINGQNVLRRACEVAAAGMHNLLMVGPPGSGKTVIARTLPTILPELTYEESMQLSKVYSVCGMLGKETGLMKKRPFRSPHHTVTPAALLGGGQEPKPGEISLAHGGVLFLDELAEFKKSTLELLREPMEEKQIGIVRASGTYFYPADFQLVAAMNPCPCGYFPDRNKCSCSLRQIANYMGKISGPLLDRIDLCVDAPVISYEELNGNQKNESSADIRKRVQAAHEIQHIRYKNESYRFNAQLPFEGIRTYCSLTPELSGYMKQIYEQMELSIRGYYKILRMARTIADLEGSRDIQMEHLLEAVSYRDFGRKDWRRDI